MPQPARLRRRGFGADFPDGGRALSNGGGNDDDDRRCRAVDAGFGFEVPKADSRGGRLPGEESAVPAAWRRRTPGACALSPLRGDRLVVAACSR